MYGIIHRAVRDLVIETAGTDAWAQLCASKGISSHIFEPMDSYSDEQTYGLIIATAEFIGRPLDEILFQFGVYWVKVTAPRDYGMIFHITGGDIFEFLEGLDAMHERIVLTFANPTSRLSASTRRPRASTTAPPALASPPSSSGSSTGSPNTFKLTRSSSTSSARPTARIMTSTSSRSAVSPHDGCLTLHRGA
jgi:hypothetical protein